MRAREGQGPCGTGPVWDRGVRNREGRVHVLRVMKFPGFEDWMIGRTHPDLGGEPLGGELLKQGIL